MKDLLFCNIPVVISEPDKINKKNLIIPMAEPVFIAVPLNRNEKTRSSRSTLTA